MRLFLLCFISFILASPSASAGDVSVKEEALVAKKKRAVYTKSYTALKSETLKKRASFRTRYNATKGNAKKRDEVLKEAQTYLVKISDDYLQSWHGTLWDFNGYTSTPRKGKIACGFLVTTIFKDMGFDIHRIKWGQQNATFVITRTSTNIREFKDMPMDTIQHSLKETGEGIYLVGLDSHIGFITYTKGEMNFVHSSYKDTITGVKSGVKTQKLTTPHLLSKSNYRLLGKLFGKEMARKWILNLPLTDINTEKKTYEIRRDILPMRSDTLLMESEINALPLPIIDL